jgi:Tol biopolymer transport system component
VAFPEGSFLVYTVGSSTSGSLAVSPRGDRLAYVGEGEAGDTTRLFVRDLASFDPVPLEGTEGGRYPAFSPDGEWIVYLRGTQLEKIPAVGGASVPLAEIQNPRGVSWELPDRILYAPGIAGGIWSVGPRGGDAVQITRPDPSRSVISHRYPHMLPDGEHFLLTAKTSTLASFDDALIMVASLATGETRTVLQGGMDARYHDGHLVYGRDGDLLAVRFDPQRLETTGTPFPIVRGVMTAPAWGCAQYDLDENGTIAYVPGDSSGGAVEIAWGDPDGGLTPIGTAPGGVASLILSPDRRHAIASIQRANDGLWMLDTERGSTVPFLNLEGNTTGGVFSNDGRRVVYASDRSGNYDLYLTSADGGDPGEPLLQDEASKLPFDFSPDDSRVLYQRVDPDTRGDIWLVPIDGDRRPEPFLDSPANETDPAFSTDGRWIAYTSDDTGMAEIYARPYPGPGPPVRISESGGQTPVWSADGRALFYREKDALVAVQVQTGTRLEAGRARRVLTLPGKSFIFDVHPDGRFLMALSEATAQRSHEVRLVRDALNE